VTVAVWAGNFDGTPLRDASGITAAGPAFHDLMLAAMRGRTPRPLWNAGLLSELEVCTLSGKLPGSACEHRRRERFARGHEPSEHCDMHVLVHEDPNGREIDARCGGQVRVRERYPLEFRAWAQAERRPLLGLELSTACPPPARERADLRIVSPRDGQAFALDADGPARQEILLSATTTATSLRFVIDGEPSAPVAPPFRLPWRLQPGVHSLRVEAGGDRTEPVTFSVTGVAPRN
jgi:penicillin-binding protein 1C